MFLFYRQVERPGVGQLEDIIEVQDGKASLRANCLPGSACQLRDEQMFFGVQASAELLSSEAFDIVLARYNSHRTPSVH